MSHKTNFKQYVSKVPPSLFGRLQLCINDAVKQPFVSEEFLKHFECFIDWPAVISNEISNETTAFLPAFLYFMKKMKLAKPWLNKQLRANTAKNKEFKCFDDILRFALPENTAIEPRNLEYMFPFELPTELELTQQDMQYAEIIAAVYITLRMKTALQRNNDIHIHLHHEFKKILSYLRGCDIITTPLPTPSLLKFEKDEYIGGIVILDVVEEPKSSDLASPNQDVVL